MSKPAKRTLIVLWVLLVAAVTINVATHIYDQRDRRRLAWGSLNYWPLSSAGMQLESNAKAFASKSVTDSDARKWLEQYGFHVGGYSFEGRRPEGTNGSGFTVTGKRKLCDRNWLYDETWLMVTFSFYRQPLEFKEVWVSEWPFHPMQEDDDWQ